MTKELRMVLEVMDEELRVELGDMAEDLQVVLEVWLKNRGSYWKI